MIHQTCSAFSIAGSSSKKPNTRKPNPPYIVPLDVSTFSSCTIRKPLISNAIYYILADEEVHWNRSYQRVSQKVCNTIILQNDSKTRFHLFSAAITKAKTQDQVNRGFRCLCGELKVCDVRALVLGLELHHVDVD